MLGRGTCHGNCRLYRDSLKCQCVTERSTVQHFDATRRIQVSIKAILWWTTNPIYMDERNKERSGWAFRDAPAAASEEVLRAPLLAEQLASNALNS